LQAGIAVGREAKEPGLSRIGRTYEAKGHADSDGQKRIPITGAAL